MVAVLGNSAQITFLANPAAPLAPYGGRAPAGSAAIVGSLMQMPAREFQP